MYGHEFRILLNEIGEYRGWSVYWQLLVPWAERHTQVRDWLRGFADRSGDPVPSADIDELHGLYALSRVNETLLLPFQQGRADGKDWQGHKITLQEYSTFNSSLGFVITTRTDFSSFYHEIVEVEQSLDDDQPITLIGEFWPCLMLGGMLFSRAGVLVSAGRNHARKEIAETSALFWAYRRKNRIVRDLSQGWGSNSQWATAFRRDVRVASMFYFNVDGKYDLAEPETKDENWHGLTKTERLELLMHRCFVTSSRENDDLYPYNDKYYIDERAMNQAQDHHD